VAKHLKRQLQTRKTATATVSENGDTHDDESVYSETSVSSRSIRNFNFSPLKYLSVLKRTYVGTNNKEVPTQLEVQSEVVEDAPADSTSNLLPSMGSEDVEEKTELLEIPELDESEESKVDEVLTEMFENEPKEAYEKVEGESEATGHESHQASASKESVEVYRDDNDGKKNTCYSDKCVIL
jgi:hypothetical protein